MMKNRFDFNGLGIIIIGICIVMKGTPCLLSVLGVWAMLIVIDIFLTYRSYRRVHPQLRHEISCNNH